MGGTPTGDAARAVRARGPAVAIAAIGFAALQAGQGLIGSFNPRIAVVVLFSLALLTATFLLQRLHTRDGEALAARARGDELVGSLRFWPVDSLAGIDPEALGVFPPRRGVDDTYIPRTADSALREAMEADSLVMVVGPRRAGKTRSAIEALRATLPADALVVVPRDGEALQRLLELDPKLAHVGQAGRQRIVWLDGLSRYIDGFDPTPLLRLAGSPEGAASQAGEARSRAVTIVATARDASWKSAVASEGADGEAAKALVACARVVQLPGALDPTERAAAEQLHQGIDLSEGIGAALSSSGTEPFVAAADRSAEKSTADGDGPAIGGPRRVRRDRGVLAPAAVTLAALATVGVLAVGGNFNKAPPPSIAEQAGSAARAGASGPRALILREHADLHGSSQDSYVFGFGDASGTPAGQARAPEIQIWDRHGDKLELAFRFEPRQASSFQYRGLVDIDGDGADELVGGYGTKFISGEILVPFAVDWNEDSDSYQMISLAGERPDLNVSAHGGARELRTRYEHRLTFNDVADEELSLSGFPAQDFVVTPAPRRLISAYTFGVDLSREERAIEVKSQTFEMSNGIPALTPCTLTHTGTLTWRAPDSSSRPLWSVLLERWQQVSKHRYCAVRS